jgi:hypothetical protein
MRRFMGMDQPFEVVPLSTLNRTRPKSEARDTMELDDTERHLYVTRYLLRLSLLITVHQ